MQLLVLAGTDLRLAAGRSAKGGMMSKSAIAALVVMLSVGAAPSLRAATQSDWENYMDTIAGGLSAAGSVVVGEVLPPGVGDVVSALIASPAVIKTGLILWLNKKMQQAAIDDDMRRLDRYQAFQTCLTKNDCVKMRAITSVGAGATGGVRQSF